MHVSSIKQGHTTCFDTTCSIQETAATPAKAAESSSEEESSDEEDAPAAAVAAAAESSEEESSSDEEEVSSHIHVEQHWLPIFTMLQAFIKYAMCA